jgi:hypothetical protein
VAKCPITRRSSCGSIGMFYLDVRQIFLNR